ncbi:MAG: hypothetical protein JNL53_02060 [Cyclobacteriaceae bacterium]|nr:hypothetical protein [Cyclobacteriaceae bacterium]
MKNITKRDVKTFLLGMLFMFLILLIYDWQEFKRGFNNGFNGKPIEQRLK